ncbi:MAG TPA: hypothetical protein VID27_16185, partial [Blastocatellia bacterium]
MRKTLFLLLGVVLVASSIIHFRVTGVSAAKPAEPVTTPLQNVALSLPNYDIRQELADMQNLPDSKSQPEIAALKARRGAIESFRASLPEAARDGLRYDFNEAGVPKAFFNLSAPLSQPSAESADEIARGFLRKHSGIFGLTSRDIRRLRLGTEDNDEGTTFLIYNQVVGGVKVFQGQVQIAVNSNGEVLSVMEGMIAGGGVDTNPVLTEPEALAAAFGFAARQSPEEFEVIQSRASRGERSKYRNPMGEGFEDILSDLRIMRVGERNVLAWHFYVDAGPNEWYEICLDADTGALLFRYNLYADVAQGTVARRDPIATPRTLESFVGDTTINT